MATNAQEFAPYYRDGLLFLPPKTVALLVDTGLDQRIGQAALRGLNLSENRQEIALISKILEHALEQLEEDSQELRTLKAPETRFMLSAAHF